MSTKELYLEISNILIKLANIKGYQFTISYGGGFDNCPLYIYYYIYYHREIIKDECLSYNTKNLKEKLNSLKEFVNERIDKK